MLVEPDYEIAHRNAATFYQSEQSQGKQLATVGLVVFIIGCVVKNGWVIGAGILVGLIGRARMERAGDVYNSANLTYAQALGAKI